MKKMVIIVMLFASAAKADEYMTQQGMLTQQEEYGVHYDEYQNKPNSSQSSVMSEYETHVCDTTNPPAVSQPMAFLTQFGCAVLIKYIALQEKMKSYFAQLKLILGQFFGFYSN